ncbi:hypothetical protein C1H46_004287 [Malus baccata]|uniref:Uncharacterized protein n=1 Tax=Malus baccata TaxID=106549 RepID=A0A540NGF0_MALBA|nr:hypothetical protein C1H46_004287 [Malus baccata]
MEDPNLLENPIYRIRTRDFLWKIYYTRTRNHLRCGISACDFNWWHLKISSTHFASTWISPVLSRFPPEISGELLGKLNLAAIAARPRCGKTNPSERPRGPLLHERPRDSSSIAGSESGKKRRSRSSHGGDRRVYTNIRAGQAEIFGKESLGTMYKVVLDDGRCRCSEIEEIVGCLLQIVVKLERKRESEREKSENCEACS